MREVIQFVEKKNKQWQHTKNFKTRPPNLKLIIIHARFGTWYFRYFALLSHFFFRNTRAIIRITVLGAHVTGVINIAKIRDRARRNALCAVDCYSFSLSPPSTREDENRALIDVQQQHHELAQALAKGHFVAPHGLRLVYIFLFVTQKKNFLNRIFFK